MTVLDIECPSDQTLQRELFGNADHPATNNLALVSRLIAALTEPGDLVFDPMAGTGATGLLAARSQRDAWCVECESKLVARGREIWEWLCLQGSLLPYGEFTFEVGDARTASPPRQADAIIFSPPYADSLPSDGRDAAYWDRFFDEKERRDGRSYTGTRKAYSRTYGESEANLGKLHPTAWESEMQRVYANCMAALAPGGRMAVILRDVVRDGARMKLVDAAAGNLEAIGFRVEETWRRPLTQLGLWTRVRKSNGHTVVEDESVLVARK